MIALLGVAILFLAASLVGACDAWTLIALFFLWVAGMALTGGALAEMGRRKADTLGDCFSGDWDLDFALIALWPVFWPCWLAFRLGRRIGLFLAPLAR